MLPRAAEGRSGTGGREVQAAEGQRATPVASAQEVGRFWAARVGLHHRVLGVDAQGVADGIVWFWIGPHGDYDKLVG